MHGKIFIRIKLMNSCTGTWRQANSQRKVFQILGKEIIKEKEVSIIIIIIWTDL